MKYPKLTPFLLLFGITSALWATSDVTPTIIARSQGRNGALKVAGLAEKVHINDAANYVNVDGALVYSQSMRPHKIAESLFGADLVNCKSILIQGRDVANRDAQAWLADYFYLPPDYNASFSIDPKIQNILVNLDLYVGLDQWMQGLYFRIYGPLTWSKWNLNFNEPCDVTASGSFGPGYFDSQAMLNAQLLDTFGQYAEGLSPINTSGTSTQSNIGVSFEGLRFAKIERCARTRTGFADLRFELGYDFLQADNYHLGLNVQVVAPSGSRRNAEFAFDSVIGNGNHWEVGGGLTAHYMFWKSQDEDCAAGLYIDASVTHINQAREQRTFDLTGRPNSRYMLAEKVGRPVNFLRAGTTVTSQGSTSVPIAQFKGVFTPVANLTTLDVNVSSAIQADIAAMINVTSRNWGFDIGYNFWARTCEKISVDEQCCLNLCNQIDTWALKGDGRVFGFLVAASGSGTGSLPQFEPVALSATECGATIHAGTNATANSADCTGIDSLQNCGIDNAKFAFARGTASNSTDQLLVHSAGTTATSDAIKTSLQPSFINCCDVNLQRTKGLSNKVFANVNYTWEKDTFQPYLGFGGSVEFSKHTTIECGDTSTPDCSGSCSNTTSCSSSCSDCLSSAVSQWAIWIKGGVSFQ